MTNPYFFFALLFVLGTGLVVVGTLLVRNERRVEPAPVGIEAETSSADVFGALAALDETSAVVSEPRPIAATATPAWTQSLVDPGTELDAATRIDMLQRLALLAQPWCTPLVRQALNEEEDPEVRAVADDMLVMILARPR